MRATVETAWEKDDEGRPVLVVDRGQPVIVTMTFLDHPDEVCAAHMIPGDERPRVDDGFGSARSQICCIDAASPIVRYRYVVDTTGASSGRGWCHVWAVGPALPGGRGSEFVRFRVRAGPPPQIL